MKTLLKLIQMSLLVTILLLALPHNALATVARQGDTFILSGQSYNIAFSARNGSILSVQQTGQGGSIFKSGEQGLWQVRFQDDTRVNAAAFNSTTTDNSFKGETDTKANALHMTFNNAAMAVRVTVTGLADRVNFTAQVQPKQKTVLDFAFPARFRFEPDQMERFVCPANGNTAVGMGFKSAFFKMQPQDRPVGWSHEMIGGQGYATLYGGSLDQRPNDDPPTTLAVTEVGRQWLGAEVAQRLNSAQAVVNRPPTRAQAELVLVDSPNGPYFSANHLGGMGSLWRVGGAVSDAEKNNVVAMVTSTIGKLSATAPFGRTKIGVVALQHGPEQGGWAGVAVNEWLSHLQSSLRANQKVQVVSIANAQALQEALRDNTYLAIVNPYGEWSPVLPDGDMQTMVEAVRNYVRASGNWFEVGGYPFFYALRPMRYLSYDTAYPDAFADFFHFGTQSGSAAVFGVQPQTWAPWAGAKNKAAIFVPGHLDCGGDEQGGYCDRTFGTYIAAGETWQSPMISLLVSKDAPQSLAAYCQANAINRRLEAKMTPAALQKFKNSVLVYYAGNAQEKLDHISQLPSPSLVHFADYLKGGFDKQYPDHLPPNPAFGTPQELRVFIDRCHALGHLVMPYTNPTWWCDHPRGPTFEQAGEAPLLRGLDGKLAYEKYGVNDGYTVSHWHPAVQAANRKTVSQFSQEYPIDVLFQDQTGARTWRYDTNPASPTAYAYADGLVSQAAEDAGQKPLSTEAGWDRVVNYESQLCGMTFGIVPTEGAPEWRHLMKQDYPPDTWEIFPLAQYIAHDKTAMLHHDLGQFVTNQEVLSWTLGLGFGLSYRVQASSLDQAPVREWLRWLDRLQKSVCSRYTGEPLTAFIHDRGPTPTVEDDGVLRATYGPINVIANLSPKSRTENSYSLPPYGFVATGSHFIAGNLQEMRTAQPNPTGTSFVSEENGANTDVWVYAAPEQEVEVRVPVTPTTNATRTKAVAHEVAVQVDAVQEGMVPAPNTANNVANSHPAQVQPTIVKGIAEGNLLHFRLPRRSETQRIEPAPALAGKAPRDWPGAKPAIGVLNFPGVEPNWTRITPGDWLKAFQSSRLATQMAVPVKAITTSEELAAALKTGPAAYFCIINPYGEKFPITAPGAWRDMLASIRHYVENGGSWWETAGYSFSQAIRLQGNNWESETVGPGGVGAFGLPIGGGEVDAPAEALHATPVGQQWLGQALSGQIAQVQSAVNRGLARGKDDPGHLTLVAGAQQDFIGGYRLNGWGWLWRIGGFWPNPDVVLPVTVAATEYLYTHPSPPVQPGGTQYLWHAVVQAR